MNAIAIGSKVGARRWPDSHAHPDCWDKPWAGVVLAIDDPRAWAHTLAFPLEFPGEKAVKAHVAALRERNRDALTSVPVLWNFGNFGSKVHWERVASLRPYSDDLAAWFKARNEARFGPDQSPTDEEIDAPERSRA